ncbi:DUF2267 domain-containing protein [Streptomyces daliensis]
MTFDELVEEVRQEGLYPTREKAERITRTVLAALGRQVTGEERVELAALLPGPAAMEFAAQIPATQRLTGFGFVQDIASRTGTSVGPARWDTGSVLCAVARLMDPGLLARILAQLPGGYALLFGQAQLTPTYTPAPTSVSTVPA